jgi:SAM-dependent methyltransferase
MTPNDEGATGAPARACPVCAHTTASVLQRMRFALPDGHPLTDAYDVVVCRECGFVYADTSSSQAEYDRYYAELSKYSDAATGTGAGEQAWDRDRLRETAAFVADALDSPSSRIVDIGCANGGLLAEFGTLGYSSLVGVDPSPACVMAVNETPGMMGHVGTLFDLPSAAREADCVLLSHVLEHVRDLEGALARVRRTLRPGGVAYIEVPDATRYTEFLVAPFQDFNVEHINHFSPVSLTNALHRSDFAVERLVQKSINASATALYPALGVIARAVEPATSSLVRDPLLEAAITNYIGRSHDMLDGIRGHLDQALADVPEVLIWGTGQTTLTLLSNIRLGPRVVALTDSNPRFHGRRLGGIPVIAPEEVARYDAPIVIGSLISHVAIERRIRDMHLPNRTVRLSST